MDTMCCAGTKALRGFGSRFWEKSPVWLTMPFKKARRVIPCKKAQLSWACSMIQKTNLSKKTRNELISYIFVNLLRYNPEDINKSMFSLLKSYVCYKSELNIVKNAQFWKI